MTDVLRQRLMDALNRAVAAEPAEAGDGEGPNSELPLDVELALAEDDVQPDPRAERARVAASVAAVLLANALPVQVDIPAEPVV
jgi:hypothetical protein